MLKNLLSQFLSPWLIRVLKCGRQSHRTPCACSFYCLFLKFLAANLVIMDGLVSEQRFSSSTTLHKTETGTALIFSSQDEKHAPSHSAIDSMTASITKDTVKDHKEKNTAADAAPADAPA